MTTNSLRCYSVLDFLTYTNCWQEVEKKAVAVVRKRAIPTERPPLVGEVSANLCG
jgi:hypothetical protein